MNDFPFLFVSELSGVSDNCLNIPITEVLSGDNPLKMPPRVYVHFDLDCFFANVESLTNPNNQNKPIAVGTSMMLSTANYEARKYGVKSAIPGYKAKIMCPDLIIIKPDMKKYQRYSKIVMDLLQTFYPLISIKSIDEAVLCFDKNKYEMTVDIVKNKIQDLRFFEKEYSTEYIGNKYEYIEDNNKHEYNKGNIEEKNINNEHYDGHNIEHNDFINSIIKNNSENEFIEVIHRKGTTEENYLLYSLTNNNKNYKSFIFKNITNDFNFLNIESLVEIIRKIIFLKTGLTISAGISVTKLLAKLASSIKKPNNQTTIKTNFQQILDKKQIDKISGIGKQTKLLLEMILNIKTVADIKQNLKYLLFIFKKKTFENIFYLSFGISKDEIDEKVNNEKVNNEKVNNDMVNNEKVNNDMVNNEKVNNEKVNNNFIDILTDKNYKYLKKQKGLSVEHTFTPSIDYKELKNVIWLLSEKLHLRLFKSKKVGNIFTLKLKFEDFLTITKQKKFDNIPRSEIEIFNNFICIFCDIELYTKVRLIGLRITNLLDYSELDLLKNFINNK
ncbi:DNA polymerase kappa [Dictyocoela muelleri]|nr:DNA polymerase kappa [Dictyocoela muelleri]